MARPIDEKLVRMTLDNAKFKDNVKETVQSFSAINDAAKGTSSINLSAIAESVEAIERRLSISGAFIASIIKNITDNAIAMGKRLYGAMIDPIVEGGKKRALNIEQAKFQFEGLGMDVEKTMKSANDAVLGTAFGLDEAAVVASQFGATGMKAGEEMTEALRGISGVAAMTGSSYQDIGSIFTNVAGNGRLMGNDLLRLGSRGVNAAATLAKAMGKTEAEIREMVTKGQISFEDFAKAMSDAFGEHATKANETYAGSLSNLRSAFARIGAEVYTPRYEQLRDIFNSLTPKVDALKVAILPLIEAFNKLSGQSTEKLISVIDKISFEEFEKLGGIENLVKSFWNVANSGKAILTALGEGFRMIFPGSLTKTLVAITAGIEKLTSGLTISGKNAEKFKVIFAGIFSIFSTVYEITKVLAKALFGVVPEGLGDGLLDFLVLLSELAIRMNDSVKEGNFLTEALFNIVKGLGSLGSWLTTPIQHLKTFAGFLMEISGVVRRNFLPVMEKLKDILKPIGEVFKNSFSNFGSNEILGVGFLGLLTLALQQLTGILGNSQGHMRGIVGSIKGMFQSIGGIFDELGGALKSFQEQVKYKNLLLIAVSIGILAVSLKMLEGMSVADIAKSLGALVGSMAILAGGMMAIEKLNFTGGIKASVTIIALSLSVAIMAGALKKLSEINLKDLGTGMLGLAGTVAIMSGAIIAISKWGGKLGTSSLALLSLATSVVILASAIETMSEINTGDLFKAVGALGLIFAELALFLILVKGSKIGPGTALGVIGVAGAIKIMAGAIADIADIDTEGLIKGLATIGIILLEVGLFSNLVSGPGIIAAAIGLTGVAAGLDVMSGAVNKLGAIDTKSLIKGLTAIGVILLEIGLFSNLVSGPKILAASVGITLIATALTIMMGPVTQMSQMSWEELAKGLGGMAVALLAVAAIGPLASGMLSGAIGVTAIAVAMNLLMGPIKKFAAMSWEEMIKGFVGLAGGIVVIAGAALLLSPAVVPMLGFAAALLAMGAAIALAGVGIGAFGLGLAALAGLTATSIRSIISAIGLLIKGFGTLITDIVDLIIEFGAVLIGGLDRLVPPLVQTALKIVTALVGGLIDFLEEMIPKLVRAFLNVVVQILEAIGSRAQELVEAGISIPINIMKGIQEKAPELMDTAMETMVALIVGMADAVAKNRTPMIDAMVRLMGEVILVVIEAGVKMINALFGWIPGVEKATSKIGETAEEYIREHFGAEEVGIEKGEDFAAGLEGTSGAAGASGAAAALAGKAGAEGVDFKETGEALGKEMNLGLESTNTTIMTTGSELSKAGKKGADSVDGSDSGVELGKEIDTGFKSTNSTIMNTGKDLMESGKDGADSVDLTPIGVGKGVQIEDGISSTTEKVKTAATNVAESGKKSADSVMFKDVGEKKSIEFADGILAKERKVENSVFTVTNAGKKEAGKVDYQPQGSKAGLGFAKGVDGQRQSAKNAGYNLSSSGQSGASSLSLAGIGANFGLSFANGMNSQRNTILNRAMSLASAASNAVAGWLRIASPSKLLTYYGNMFGDGFGVGIADRVKSVAHNAKEMAVGASRSLRENLEEIKPDDEEIIFKLVVDDDDFNPDDYKFDGPTTRPRPVFTQGMVESAENQTRQSQWETRSSDKSSEDDNYDKLYSETVKQNKILTGILNKRTVIDKKDMVDTVNEENAIDDILQVF